MNETHDSTNTTTNTFVTDHFYSGLIGLLGSLAILLNGPLLIVLVKSKTLVFRSRMNYLVGSLALADFLTGIATVSYSTANAELSSIHFTLVWITIGASSMTLLLMSAERLIVLSYPLTWPFILTKRRTLASIAITWGVSLACGLSIRFSGTPLAMFAVTTLFELAILTVVVLHTIIFGYLRKWPAPAQALDEPQNKKTHRRLEHVSQSNATTVLLILVVIFIFTVLPTIVVLQLFAAYWMGFVPASSFEGLAQSHHYLHPIELLNFVANPIVYAWRLKQYRKALGETFATFKQRLCSFGLDHRNTATKRMMK